MPHGFFTLEKWTRSRSATRGTWKPLCHANSDRSLSDLVDSLQRLGKPGFYRIIQTQRMIWAEKTGGKFRLRKWHARSPQTLSRTADAFIRDRGKWPAVPARRPAP